MNTVELPLNWQLDYFPQVHMPVQFLDSVIPFENEVYFLNVLKYYGPTFVFREIQYNTHFTEVAAEANVLHKCSSLSAPYINYLPSVCCCALKKFLCLCLSTFRTMFKYDTTVFTDLIPLGVKKLTAGCSVRSWHLLCCGWCAHVLWEPSTYKTKFTVFFLWQLCSLIFCFPGLVVWQHSRWMQCEISTTLCVYVCVCVSDQDTLYSLLSLSYHLGVITADCPATFVR